MASVQSGLVAYYRVSTDKQGITGLGMEAQQEAVRRWAALSDRKIIAEFVEVESGTNSKRPQLALALSHARRCKAALCVAKLDRLSRNVTFLSTLMDSGAEFVACDNPHANRLTLHILAAVAEDESRRISERTKAALAAYKARGGVLGGSRPESTGIPTEAALTGRQAGSRANRDRAVMEYASEATIARGMVDAGSSLQSVADHLNANGHRTVSGGQFSKVHVHRILKRCKMTESKG